MIRLAQVHQFMNENVFAHIRRHQHQPEVQRDMSAGRTRSPARALIAGGSRVLEGKPELHVVAYCPMYLLIQLNTDSCQYLLSSAFSTQCPSAENTSASAGTPLRRSAVKSWRP